MSPDPVIILYTLPLISIDLYFLCNLLDNETCDWWDIKWRGCVNPIFSVKHIKWERGRLDSLYFGRGRIK